MAIGRWNKAPLAQLEAENASLKSKLEQALASSDIAMTRDMLNRAGILFNERPGNIISINGQCFSMHFSDRGSLLYIINYA